MPSDRPLYQVFISSTGEDALEPYRQAAKAAIEREGMRPMDYKVESASGQWPVDVCLERVDQADLVVAIISHRCGWLPPDQPAGEEKSITRLECERACNAGKRVIPFLLSEDESLGRGTRDEDDLRLARREGRSEDEIARVREDVDKRCRILEEFKAWLEGKEANWFSERGELEGQVTAALSRWQREQRQQEDLASNPAAEFNAGARELDRDAYREWVARTYSTIDAGPLEAPDADAVVLDSVYVPAVTLAAPDPDRDEDESRVEPRRERDALLLDCLGEASLYVPGEAGSGKSTFCRWLAECLGRRDVPQSEIPPPEGYGETLPDALRDKLPVIIRLRRLQAAECFTRVLARLTAEGPLRLEEALGIWLDETRPGEGDGALNGARWSRLMRQGECVLILDGLDELPAETTAPVHHPRREFVAALAAALPQWTQAGNRVLLTSRPYGLERTEQAHGLTSAPLQPLPRALRDHLVRRWFAARNRDDPNKAQARAAELVEALRASGIAGDLTERPLLLAALCALYDESPGELPQRIHELYERLVDQVLASRFRVTGSASGIRELLSAVALGVHTGQSALASQRSEPAFQIGQRELERLLGTPRELPDAVYRVLDQPASARELAERLQSRSGLLRPAEGRRVEFVVARFQEFLAADRIAQAADMDALEGWFQAHAGAAAWRDTLHLLFCAIAEEDVEAALALCRRTLLERIDQPQRPDHAAAADLMVQCLLTARETATAGLKPFYEPLKRAAYTSLETDTTAATRALLWSGLGQLGIDDRPGVGLREDGLPDIAWCEVAGGQVEVEEDVGTCEVASFRISRHPITHAQFQAFVEADDGYGNEACWKPEWLEHRRIDLSDPPRAKWPISNHPREHVNWYEAMAFCRWLDARLRTRGELGDAEQLRLPFEWEWQHAASWDPDRRRHYEWPWGDNWEAGKANTGEGEALKRTTPVGIYPDGGAPCGALDMAGNVDEWCLNAHDAPAEQMPEDAGRRALRGGSWIDNRLYARAAFRGGYLPGSRLGSFGFRVCVASPILGH